jgi:hypothetical protein
MSTADPAGQRLTELVKALGPGWPGGAWEWDRRLDCALSTVSKATEAGARAALAAQLPAVWTPEKLAAAPAALREICRSTGGLMAGQLVFAADLPGEALAFCLWWPWGSGANFSARLGARRATGNQDLGATLRTAFALR